MESDWNLLGLLIAAALALAFAVVHAAVRRRQQRRDEAVHAESIEHGLHLPPSLHPVIDPDICIGSLACLKACPEGDILGIVDGAARLIRASECIGHGRCAVACPVNAIKLVFGTAERGVDLPEVNERFESSRRGVHVVGELGGMGLIRNAVEQGTQCAGFLAEALRGRRPADGVDVVIVGAGPAGLATAMGLRANGLSFRVLDQGVFGGTIANYPRQKVVMTEPLELPGAGRLRKRHVAKEELLAFFDKATGKNGFRVDERAKVIGVDGQDGAFVVRTERGSVAARKVVLATGRRGSPRKLGVPGEQLTKVTYLLTDAEQYVGSRVLVVGGGDAAVEAACSLAEQDCEVALSYRGDELSKCRPPNRARAQELADQGHLALLLGSQVKQIAPEVVSVQKGSDTLALPNEYVIACLGGELPLEFLKSVGVGVRRHHGEVAGAGGGASASRRLKLSLQKEREQGARSRRRLTLYAVAGAAVVAILWAVGHEYYPLARSLRLRSPLHASLKSAGTWGHGVGIGATAVMLLNFLYYVRKRWRFMNGWGSLRSWLDFHVFVGFMSPLVIAFHAAFQSNNHLATGTSAALGIVVGTGLIGRFFYGLIPGGGDKVLEMSELLGQLERLKERLQPLVAGAKASRLEALYRRAGRKPSQAPLLVQVLLVPLEKLFLRVRLLFALPSLPEDERETFREALIRLQRLRVQAGLFKGIKRLMSIWRTLHASLAVLLVFAIAAHVAVSMYLGYGFGRR
jgi:thioredoxin reductase/NAD-dependent dihydropyrimidine dehydrogenase PreA subunit